MEVQQQKEDFFYTSKAAFEAALERLAKSPLHLVKKEEARSAPDETRDPADS